MADIADDPPAFVLERRLERAQPTRRPVETAGRLLHDRRLGVREELLLVGREPGRDLRRIELAVVAADQVGSPGTPTTRAVAELAATNRESPVLGEDEVRQGVEHGPIELVLRRSRAGGSQRLLEGADVGVHDEHELWPSTARRIMRSFIQRASTGCRRDIPA